MSFAEEVKNEAAHLQPENDDCARAELAALLCMGCTVVAGPDGTAGMEFSTSNNAVARKALSMWLKSFSLRPEVLVRRGRKLRKKNIYTLRVPFSEQGRAVLESLDLYPQAGSFDHLDLKRSDCRRAFLRGAFMGGGSVNQPRGDYHLELVTANDVFAQRILKVMRQFHLKAKLTDRKGEYLVYVKEGNGVSSFLQYIGTDQACLKFESARVFKDMRNNVNRVVNCETANLQKTVDAAVRQIKDIQLLQASGFYSRLTPRLQEAAELRLTHREASLSELAELSGLTKSGLTHRYKKLALMAKEIEGMDKNDTQ
jgi:DNA-binding protein WhiA